MRGHHLGDLSLGEK